MLPASEQGGRGLGSREGAALCVGSSVAAGGEVEVRTPDKEPGSHVALAPLAGGECQKIRGWGCGVSN